MSAHPQARGTPAQAPVAAPLPPPPPGDRAELRALAQKRSELERQLESVTDRREELADQMSTAALPAKVGLQERINVLDERAARLEQEILQADDAISVALASGISMDQTTVGSGTSQGPDFETVDRDVMFGGFLAFVLLAFAMYRWGFARARAKFSRGAPPADTARLDQLQTAVDAIALEIERISEGQRYVTKVLGEGSAQPVDIEAGEQALVRRKAT